MPAHNPDMRCLPAVLLVSTLMSGCNQPGVRQWLDSGTAVTVTAQQEPLILARDDFPAGVNVRDYVELGLFDVNRSGQHLHYLSVVLWSTVDRGPDEMKARESAFAGITLWLDDQPVQLTRIATESRTILVSAPVFPLPSPNARVAYYPISRAQLGTLAVANQLTLSTSGGNDGGRPYVLWRGKVATLREFAAQLP